MTSALARLCLLFAEQFNGIVALPGNPAGPGEPAPALPGRLVALRPFDDGEPISEDPTCFFADAEFLKNWLHDFSFKMSA